MTAADLSHPAFSNSTVAQKEAFLDPGKFLLFGGASTLKTKLGQTPLPPLYLGDGNASSSATFLLSASVDSAGNLASGGIFEVRGSETVSGGTITLLKGTLTELSQAVFAENKLHFKASVDTSSDLYSLFGDEIVIETHSLGPMDFTDWFMVSNRTADMGRPVPEPSTFFALGAVVCVGGLQRRRKAKTAA